MSLLPLSYESTGDAKQFNKGRFCNTIASIALVQPQSCPETSTANSRLVRAKGGFKRRYVLITKEDG